MQDEGRERLRNNKGQRLNTKNSSRMHRTRQHTVLLLLLLLLLLLEVSTYH
jgi:hypothetical protein